MNVLINKEVDTSKWVKLLNDSAFSSPFQTPEYYHFNQTVEFYSAEVFAVEDNDRYISLVVVNIQREKGWLSYFSRRGIIYGGPVIIENNTEGLSLLLNSIHEYYSGKLIYVEIRNFFDFSAFKSIFITCKFDYVPWLNFLVKTNDLTLINSSMSSSRLRQIRKALKNGAIWKESDSIEEIKAFYLILSDLYRKKIKKPLPPLSFFTNFLNSGVGKYLFVFKNEKLIGGIMCPIMQGKAIYEFYVCGLDTEYKDQYPSVIATWAAIEYAHKNNIPKFDFMGAGNPSDEYGVREFKSRFGGEMVEYGRFIMIINGILYNIGKTGLTLLKNIKR